MAVDLGTGAAPIREAREVDRVPAPLVLKPVRPETNVATELPVHATLSLAENRSPEGIVGGGEPQSRGLRHRLSEVEIAVDNPVDSWADIAHKVAPADCAVLRLRAER